ncbi:ABC transporter ATP-binding protein [Alkalihalobacillus pseudalcaliphilus]|uniref:ABC transporter ATP-binding protein n=1 Tax=Alkalihalobacillus pseudalcaliphilus TaxID=79884 RepID=UPI00064E04C7|nr:ABC transporter ATP-binding protein [Alkalihalobacillus pseudalcaliphilus]KMK74978.1 peptide ABC transporter ATP-binding protein [Alkalihalobacillus pseudalcaliphilus]
MKKQTLLEVKHLQTSFETERGPVTAVDDVSFEVNSGEILGIVGESGSGKSVTAQSITRLHDEHFTSYNGEVLFEGENILTFPVSKVQRIRGNEISMIFQDPLSSLNPVHKVGKQIVEAILLHKKVSKKAAKQEAVELLRKTGIPSPEERYHEYPHQLSGGMQQRVGIAIALACQPKLLIADEPTTALDVTIQAQILKLMTKINEDSGMGVMFITHDLGVVAQICTRVMVMYLGQVVEVASTKQLFNEPLHPYALGLMESIPKLEGDRHQKLSVIEGVVPSLSDIPNACRFAPRCPLATSICVEKEPQLEEVKDGRQVRCWHYEKLVKEENEHGETSG